MTETRKSAYAVAASVLGNEVVARRRRFAPGEAEAHAITRELALLVEELRARVAAAEQAPVVASKPAPTRRAPQRRGRSHRSRRKVATEQ